jgi:hypothetical protein
MEGNVGRDLAGGRLDDEQRVRAAWKNFVRRDERYDDDDGGGRVRRVLFSTRGAAMFYGYVLRRASRRAVHP